MTKYRVSGHSITPVEIISETRKTVTFYDGPRDGIITERKVANHHIWFDTFVSAKAFAVKRAELEVDAAYQRWQNAQRVLSEVENLQDNA